MTQMGFWEIEVDLEDAARRERDKSKRTLPNIFKFGMINFSFAVI